MSKRDGIDKRTREGRKAAGLPPPAGNGGANTIAARSRAETERQKAVMESRSGWRMRYDIESVAHELGAGTLMRLAVEDPKWFYEKLAVRLLPKILESSDQGLTLTVAHKIVDA